MRINRNMINEELRRGYRMQKLLMKRACKANLKLQYRMSKNKVLPVPEDLDCSNVFIERGDGTSMRIRVYKPLNMEKRGPAILWIHGGGYALGAPETGVVKCKRLIEESGAVIVSPDYRLSLEEPYPAALDDCYLALLWLAKNAEWLGGRSDQIMLAGESAGGGMAAALALLARDKKDVNVAFHMPLYPMIDDRPTESSEKNNAPIWNAYNNRVAWKVYLGDLFKSGDIPYYAAPARAADYSNLPPALSFVGGIDPFRDEIVTYCDNLNKAGIPAQCRVYEGCYHGFDVLYPDAAISKRALEEFYAAFKQAVRTYFKPQMADCSDPSAQRTFP